MVFLESIFSCSIVNAKISMCSRSSGDFAPKEEDAITVRRLSIFLLGLAPCTVAISIFYPSFSHFSSSLHCLDKARRCHCSSVLSSHRPPSKMERLCAHGVDGGIEMVNTSLVDVDEPDLHTFPALLK